MNPARPSILTLLAGLFRALFQRTKGRNPYVPACLIVLLLAGPAYGAATMPTVEEVAEAKVEAVTAKTEAGEAKTDANVALISACVAGVLAILAAAGTLGNALWTAWANAQARVAKANADAQIEIAKARDGARLDAAVVKGDEATAHANRLSNRVFELAKIVTETPSAVAPPAEPNGNKGGQPGVQT